MKWDTMSSGLLFRIADEGYGGELLLISDSYLFSWETGRLIFETPFFLAGNIKPRGLYRFLDMRVLLDREELKHLTIWTPDRSQTSLDSPGGAVSLPGKGGLFFQSRNEESLQSGGWISFNPLSYCHLDLGFHHGLFSGGKETETEWFSDQTPQPAGGLWHGAGDIKYDRAVWTGRIRAAVSGGEQYLPGTSLMPDLVLYLKGGRAAFRYWRNSAFYRNRQGEFPDWNWQFQGEYKHFFNRSCWEISYLEGGSRPEPEGEEKISRESRVKWERDGRFLDWKFQGSVLADSGGDRGLKIESGGKVYYPTSPLTFWLSGLTAWDGYPPVTAAQEWTCGIRRRKGKALSFNLSLSYAADAADANISPRWEAGFRRGLWVFKGKGGYNFALYGGESSPVFSLSAEKSF